MPDHKSGCLTLADGRSLSLRQTQVLALILQGKTAKDIGQHLGISPKTAETYTDQLKDIFGCRKKTELIAAACAQNLYRQLVGDVFVTPIERLRRRGIQPWTRNS